MNLREIQLSSRSVIPVALALPINRGPEDTRVVEELERRTREVRQHERDQHDQAISFYL
jgi:hypothetical protein